MLAKSTNTYRYQLHITAFDIPSITKFDQSSAGISYCINRLRKVNVFLLPYLTTLFNQYFLLCTFFKVLENNLLDFINLHNFSGKKNITHSQCSCKTLIYFE